MRKVVPHKPLINTVVIHKSKHTKKTQTTENISQSTINIDNVSIALWDAVAPCSLTLCLIRQDCPFYPTMSATKPKPCGVQSQYLEYIFMSIVKRNAEKLTQDQLDQIGFHLIPLYSHLIKFKMVEFSLLAGSQMGGVMLQNVKGGISMHPVYKEIRDTLRQINDMWSSIGLNKLKITRPRTAHILPFGENDDNDYSNGDPEYADRLMSGDLPAIEQKSETLEDLQN